MAIDRIRESDAHCSTSSADKHVNPSASSLFESQAVKPGEGLLVSKGAFEPADVIGKKCSVFVSLPSGC